MYQLRAPASQLRAFIENYWFVHATPGAPVDLGVDVFVDGRADLVFNFGAPYTRAVRGAKPKTMRKSNLDAQRLVPIRIEQKGQVRVTGVRFHVGGLAPFTKTSLKRFTGQTVSPQEVLGDEVRRTERKLRHASDVETQVEVLDSFFLELFRATPSTHTFMRALQLAQETTGRATVAQMARASKASARHVERLFSYYLGFSPKVLAQVLRFQHTLKALMHNPNSAQTLAVVAADAGYFDQAHFTKSFKLLTGDAPSSYSDYYPKNGPSDFAPNVVAFVQDSRPRGKVRPRVTKESRWENTGREKAPKKRPGSSKRRR